MPLNFVQSPPLGGEERHSKHPIHNFISTNPFHRTTACKKGHYKGKKSRNQMIENIWLNHESRRLQRNHVAQSAQSAQLDQQFTPAIILHNFSLCSMTANILCKICNFSFDISSTLDNKRKFFKIFSTTFLFCLAKGIA